MATIVHNQADPKEAQTKQLFNNPILEKLTHTHFAVPITILTVAAILVLYLGFTTTTLSTSWIIGLFFLGLLTFTLAEYLIHRHIFHMAPSKKWKAFVAYKFHGVHHDYPKDKSRLAMPPIFSTILATLLFFAFKLVMGDMAFGFMPGFLIGYTGYLLVHYVVHAYQPPKNILKELWINHGIHHYKDDSIAFGVSSPLWDYIFGTIPKKKKRK